MQTRDLVAFADSDRFQATYDVAIANLVCAQGLPGSEKLDLEAVLDWVDDAAKRVEFATQLSYHRFIDRPAAYGNSQAIFCMAVLMTVLQRELGVKYNPARISDPYDFRNAQDRFIHGIMHGDGGTCMTLPVLVAAVARRLGYPVRLVKGTVHLFCRWDGAERSTFLMNDRFNIEATAEGLVCHPDRFYLKWPYPLTDPVWDPQTYLRSLTPREELALFFGARGFVLMEHGKYVQAIEAYTAARELEPENMRYRAFQDQMFLLGLNIPMEEPPDADRYVQGPDGKQWKAIWWPEKIENPELLPAASLPGYLLDQMVPPPEKSEAPGMIADALAPNLQRLTDSQWVKRLTDRMEMELYIARTDQENYARRTRQDAIFDEMDRQTAIYRDKEDARLRALGMTPFPRPRTNPATQMRPPPPIVWPIDKLACDALRIEGWTIPRLPQASQNNALESATCTNQQLTFAPSGPS